MSALRVALVYPACNRRGGVERCVREVARSLARKLDVTFVGDDFDPAGMDGVHFQKLGGRRLAGSLELLGFRRRAAKAVRDGGYDVVISWGAQCPPGDIQCVASVHRAWLRQGRSIPTRFGRVPNVVRYVMPQHAARLLMERRYFSAKSSTVTVLSEQNAAEVAGIYKVSPSRIVIVPNGYSAREFSAERSLRERAARREVLGLGDGQVLLLLVANELHRKGFGVLLEAVAALKDPSIVVAVVGRASIDAYRSTIARLGLSSRVHWHGPTADVGAWYAAADLFVMPSQYEAYPLVVIEALASGLPVITTAVAGSIDAVQVGVNGLLQQDPDDAGELAGLIRRGLDAEVRAEWRAAAADSVSRLEWDRISEQYLRLIDEVAQ